MKSTSRYSTTRDILNTEWDPIGVHTFFEADCCDEYDSHVQSTLDLIDAGGSVEDISEHLLAIEEQLMEISGGRRRRAIVARMLRVIVGGHPSSEQSPIVDSVSADFAYPTVLELIDQTRIDAYRKDWGHVQSKYETAVALCDRHLAPMTELRGCCLNNLGIAYSKVGNFRSAQECFEMAIRALDPSAVSDDRLFLLCAYNMIEIYRFNGEEAAARNTEEKLRDYMQRMYGSHIMDSNEVSLPTDSRMAPHLSHLPIERDRPMAPRVIQIE